MKKVLCLIDSLASGGAQRQIVGLAVLLRQKGYDVKLITYYDIPFYLPLLIEGGVEYENIHVGKGLFARLFKINRAVRHFDPDVVISYLDTPSICACFARLFNHSFRLFVSERNTTQTIGLKDWIKFNLYRKAEFVIPNSFAQGVFINNNFTFLTKKTVVIPNFVDLKQFYPQSHLRKSVPEIIIVASIWHSKNTLGLIEAVELLVKRGLKFHISWYGKSLSNMDYFEACEKKISEKGVFEYISLLDKTTCIAEKYRESDYFCLPSFYEGTPNVICEAMASGLPVACSNVCDNGRYVEDGVNGFLFNPKVPDSIAESIEKLIGLDVDRYNTFCRMSRQYAEERFSYNTFVNSYIKLIEA